MALIGATALAVFEQRHPPRPRPAETPTQVISVPRDKPRREHRKSSSQPTRGCGGLEVCAGPHHHDATVRARWVSRASASVRPQPERSSPVAGMDLSGFYGAYRADGRGARIVQGSEVGSEAVDRQRRAPVRLVTGDRWRKSGRIHLQFHKRRARMIWTRWNLDVGVAVRLAHLAALGVALGVAHRQAEPDRRRELEFVRRSAERRRGLGARVDRKHRVIGHAVRGPALKREEPDVRFVVSNVMPVVLESVLVVGGDLRTPQLTVGRLNRTEPVAVQPALWRGVPGAGAPSGLRRLRGQRDQRRGDQRAQRCACAHHSSLQVPLSQAHGNGKHRSGGVWALVFARAPKLPPIPTPAEIPGPKLPPTPPPA